MKAIVQAGYGDTGVLERKDVPVATPGPAEVLIRVHAAGLDRGTWHLMTGTPLIARLAFGLRAPKQPILGMALAGVVEAVGAEVTDLAVGDEVFGTTTRGSFAEYCVASPRTLARKPASLSFEEAASLPISATTALQALRDHGRLRPGQQVLVIGASGGVGCHAVQLAKALGAEVTGVSSTAKLDLVRDLGADHVVDYTREDLGSDGRRYDLILDIGGIRPVSELRERLTPTGTLLLVGGEGGGRWLGGMERSLGASLLSLFIRQRLVFFVASDPTADLEALAGFRDRGELRPVVDRAYPLADAAVAMTHLTSGQVRGKVVLSV